MSRLKGISVPKALGIMVLIALAVCAPMLLSGAPHGHSYTYNLSWMQGFTAQLAQGDLYPRWLVEGNFGGGSAAFYYYAPFPFYVTAIPGLLFPQSSPLMQLAWGEWMLIALSGVAFVVYARERFALPVAVPAAAIYMVLPYHFEIDLWQRQDVGELAAYIFMPLILLYTDRIFDKRRGVVGLAVSYALLVLSHLPSALLFSICLGVYVIALIRGRESAGLLLKFAGGVIVGLMLSAVYWVPALSSLHYVHAAEGLWTLPQFDFHKWFFPVQDSLRQLPILPVIAERLFAILCAMTLVFLICGSSCWRWREAIGARKMVGALAMLAIAWFLMTPLSTFVWEHAPALSKVQFPYRLGVVVDVTAALAALYAMHCAYTQRDRIATAAVLGAAALLGWSLMTGHFQHDLGDWRKPGVVALREQFVRDRGEAREYITRWSTQESGARIQRQDRIVYDKSAGTFSVSRWNARDIGFDVSATRPVQVTVRQFYFPNWRAVTESGLELKVSPSTPDGLTVVDLPKGTYRVSLRLEMLPQEWIGTLTTLLAVLGLLAFSGLRTPAAAHLRRLSRWISTVQEAWRGAARSPDP